MEQRHGIQLKRIEQNDDTKSNGNNNNNNNDDDDKICSAHISTLLGAQGANPETPGQAPSLSRKVSWVLLRALDNTQDLQLYVPSEGRSNYG